MPIFMTLWLTLVTLTWTAIDTLMGLPWTDIRDRGACPPIGTVTED